MPHHILPSLLLLEELQLDIRMIRTVVSITRCAIADVMEEKH